MSDAELIASVELYTKTNQRCRSAMVNALRRIDRDNIPGDIVECGVWRGGNIILARKVCPDRVCWLYDTFCGMTEPGPEDKLRSGAPALPRYQAKSHAGWMSASVLEVDGTLCKFGVYDETKLRFVVGDVCETLQVTKPPRIAFLRLDTDWYSSTKVELEVLYPLLSPGGVLIVDDYGHWLGARKAVDDYFEDVFPGLTMIDYSAGMLIKQ